MEFGCHKAGRLLRQKLIILSDMLEVFRLNNGRRKVKLVYSIFF